MLEERASFLNPPEGTTRRRRARTAVQRDTEASDDSAQWSVHTALDLLYRHGPCEHWRRLAWQCLPFLCGENARCGTYALAVSCVVTRVVLEERGVAGQKLKSQIPLQLQTHTHHARHVRQQPRGPLASVVRSRLSLIKVQPSPRRLARLTRAASRSRGRGARCSRGWAARASCRGGCARAPG